MDASNLSEKVILTELVSIVNNTKVNKDQEVIKLQALDMICKIKGLYNPDKE